MSHPPVEVDGNRARRAQLANMRQELMAPVTGILGYVEILLDEARRRALDDAVPDLERIAEAARTLMGLADRMMDMDLDALLAAGKALGEVQSKLRHDLRTPINGIKGYGEMLQEDLADMGAADLASDLERMLAESDRLLSDIDQIVDFSRARMAVEETGGENPTQAMVAQLVRTIKPVAQDERKAEPGRILVVDDNPTNRELLNRRLSRDGHQVVTAPGGREALELLAARPFDLVLLDLMMPGMNGYEVLAEIKANDGMRGIPVIMISALDEVDTVIRCIEAGAEDYLAKPFNPILLNARINACLEKKRWHDRERMYLDRLEEEKAKNEELLLAILPRKIVGRLNEGEKVIADSFPEATVLFSDLVGFTKISSRLSPAELVNNLNALFTKFDELTHRFGVEKVKTIGDAYMAVAGAPEARPDHMEAVCDLALAMVQAVQEVNERIEDKFDIRVGIATGPVVAGIIGRHRFVYDIWGDTVNTASRYESYCVPNRIHVTKTVAEALAGTFRFEARGEMDIRGKGRVETYFLNGRL